MLRRDTEILVRTASAESVFRNAYGRQLPTPGTTLRSRENLLRDPLDRLRTGGPGYDFIPDPEVLDPSPPPVSGPACHGASTPPWSGSV